MKEVISTTEEENKRMKGIMEEERERKRSREDGTKRRGNKDEGC